jgi:hypothetical protein
VVGKSPPDGQRKLGRLVDTYREAEHFLQSRQPAISARGATTDSTATQPDCRCLSHLGGRSLCPIGNSFRLGKVTRVEGHHSAARDHHCFARCRIPSLASMLVSDCKLTKAGDGNRFASLKGGLVES